MAATLPTESQQVTAEEAGKRGARKQWSVHAGGPKGLLRRMRSQLAEDGCPDSQLVMGRTLLEHLDQEGGKGGGGAAAAADEEEARLAVFWLTRASHQGSSEATDLLQHCLKNNIGICEHNYHEVRDCLAMDLQEKLARKAGRLLFASVSDGNEVVSTGSLVKKVEEVLKGEVLKGDVQGCPDTKEQGSGSASPHGSSSGGSTLEELYGGERFTEEHITSAAVLYHQGRISPLHHLLALPLSLAHAQAPRNTLAKLARYPLALLLPLYAACLRFLAITVVERGRKCVVAWAPFALAVMFVLSYVFGPCVLVLWRLVPALVFCGSFLGMAVSSARILLNGQRLECLRVWSRVFSQFCPELDVTGAEGRFLALCWHPYAVLCASVLMYVSATPMVPHSLMVAFLPVMCAFSSLLFFLAVNRVAMWHFISLALYLMALMPEVYEWVGVALQGVGVSGWWVAGETLQLWGRISLHLGIGTLLHVLWLSLQVCVGVVRGSSHLPPHLASLVWSHLALVGSSKVAGPQDLLYPVVSWLAVVLVPAAVSRSVFVMPVLLCAVLGKFSAAREMLVLVFLLSGCLTFLAQRTWPRVASTVLRAALACAVILALLRPSAVFTTVSAPSQHSALQWEAYKNVCAPPKALEAGNVHGCAPLLGTAVKWRGSVIQINVAEIRNLPQIIVSHLPSFLEAPVKCYLGKRVPECQSRLAGDGTMQDERCKVIRTALGPNACSLHNWNEYEFDVKLGMQSSYWKFGGGESEVSLHADDAFRDFVLGLQSGDVVEFTATMKAGVGTHHLSLTVSAIKCVTCKLKPVDVASAAAASPHPDSLWDSGKYLFNFFLAPTLTV